MTGVTPNGIEDDYAPQLVIRPLAGHAQTVCVLLALCAFLSLVAIGSDFLQWRLLSRDYSETEADANDLRQLLVGLIQLVVGLVTAVVFLTWLTRANNNLPAFGFRRASYAIAAWFIPLANLLLPYLVVRHIRRASLEAASRTPSFRPSRAPARLVLAWWVVFMSANLAALDWSVEMRRARTIEGVMSATQSGLWMGAAAIVAAGLAIAVVLDITKLQDIVRAYSLERSGQRTDSGAPGSEQNRT